MFTCMGCQGCVLDEKFVPTPCPGLMCKKNGCPTLRCTSNCRPKKICKTFENKLKIDSSKCSPDCLLLIHCGNKIKKCKGCFKTNYFKSVIKHGKILCSQCEHKNVEETNVSS